MRRRFTLALSSLLAISAVMGVHFVRTAASSGVPDPWHQQTFANLFGVRGMSFPLVSNGYAISFLRDVSGPTKGRVHVARLSNGQVIELPFWIQGVAAIHIDSAAVTPRGDRLLLVGEYTLDPEGVYLLNGLTRLPMQPDHVNKLQSVVNFLADIALDNSRPAQVKQLDVTPERVCTIDGSTTWILGQDWPKESQATDGLQDYHLLRHYSSDGTLIASFVSRTSVSGFPVPLNYHTSASSHVGFMSCAGSSIGLLLGRPGALFWAMLNQDTGVLQQQIIRAPKALVPTGVALISTDAAYVSFGTRPRVNEPRIPGTWFSRPVSLYVLRPQNGTWGLDRITDPDRGQTFSVVLGHDGASLVHLLGPTVPKDDPTVYWTTP